MLASLALGLADAGVRVVQGVPASGLGGGEPLGPVALGYLMRGEGAGLFTMPVMMLDRGLPGTTRLRAERLLRTSEMAGSGVAGGGGVGVAGAMAHAEGEALHGKLGAWIHKGLRAGLMSGLGLGRLGRAEYPSQAPGEGSASGAMPGSGSEPIDIVHCFGEPGLWNLGLAVSQMARKRLMRRASRGSPRGLPGAPLLIEIYSTEQIAAARRWLGAMSGGPSRIWWLCADESLKQDLQRSLRPAAMRQVITVPWGVSRISAARARSEGNGHEAVLLAYGGLGEGPIDAEAFVKACAEVRRALAEHGQRLVVVCDDQTQVRGRLKVLMQREQMSEDLVVLPGVCEQWDLLETVDCVACLHPQREVSGVVMRAAGHGIPVVLSEQAMVSWLVEGQSAAGVQPQRSESWQAAILRVLGTQASISDPVMVGGQSIIASRHTLSGWTESLLKVYDMARRAMDT